MSDGSSMKIGDKAVLDIGEDPSGYSEEAQSFDKKIVTLKKRVMDIGWYIDGLSRWFLDKDFSPLNAYGKSLKPGDKAMLVLGEDTERFCSSVRELDGKVVTISRKHIYGWWIEEADIWFCYKRFYPCINSDKGPGQCCNNPCIRENFANFKKFLVCHSCGKEI